MYLWTPRSPAGSPSALEDERHLHTSVSSPPGAADAQDAQDAAFAPLDRFLDCDPYETTRSSPQHEAGPSLAGLDEMQMEAADVGATAWTGSCRAECGHWFCMSLPGGKQLCACPASAGPQDEESCSDEWKVYLRKDLSVGRESDTCFDIHTSLSRAPSSSAKVPESILEASQGQKSGRTAFANEGPVGNEWTVFHPRDKWSRRDGGRADADRGTEAQGLRGNLLCSATAQINKARAGLEDWNAVFPANECDLWNGVWETCRAGGILSKLERRIQIDAKHWIAPGLAPLHERREVVLKAANCVKHEGKTPESQRSTKSKYVNSVRLAYNMIVTDHVIAMLQRDIDGETNSQLLTEVLRAHEIVQEWREGATLPDGLIRLLRRKIKAVYFEKPEKPEKEFEHLERKKAVDVRIREVMAEFDVAFTDALLEKSTSNAASCWLRNVVAENRKMNKEGVAPAESLPDARQNNCLRLEAQISLRRNLSTRKKEGERMESNRARATEFNHRKLEEQIYAELLAAHVGWLFDSAVGKLAWYHDVIALPRAR